MATGSNWTQAEIDACVRVYLDLQRRLQAGEEVVKERFYEAAEKGTDNRGVKSVVYRFSNISAVLEKHGKPWIKGLPPRRQVGPGPEAKILKALELDPADVSPAWAAHQAAQDEPEHDVGGVPQKVLRQVAQRRGQSKFRERLINAYGKCAITGCTALPALEAAHIEPYAKTGLNVVSNGLLLRSDIHTLFDLGLLGIMDGEIRVARELREDTTYGPLHGKRASLPSGKDAPNNDALNARAPAN